ncbi:unnamed protein product [Bursaphelenchus xylophilus]|uniref:non-specific serine/threonine protein kinase n=1 Tax=Bursaphelenchus xylophilus TaxID=6326 RepID=A0A1I7SVL2_BURXY|nr:unnamed protein product [Bursaphelenchus xylophilus]CAG9101618.1 unnamed protein product [Bursaphelenchus xylophilus]
MLKFPGFLKQFPGFRAFQVLYGADRMKNDNQQQREQFREANQQLSVVKYNIPQAFQDVFQIEKNPQKVVRKLVCASLVDSLVQLAPNEKKEVVKKAIVAVLSRADVFSPVYMSDDLQKFRDPLTQVINSFVTSTTSFFPLSVLSPRIDASLSYSIGDFSIVSSRYRQDFEEIADIGSGGFGRVYKVKSRLDGNFYAVKKIPLRSAQTDVLSKTVKECKYHASLQDPHIVRYHNAWVELHSMENFESPRVSTAHQSTASLSEPFFEPNSEASDSLIRFSNDSHARSTPIKEATSDESTSESSEASSEEKEGGSSGNSSDFSSSNEVKEVAVRRKRYSRSSHSKWETVQGTYPMLFIQMELCHASLETYLLKRSQQKLAEVDHTFNSKIVEDVLSAIDFLHDRNVIHRDVKPSNVFLKKYPNGRIRALIGDFGLAIGDDELKDDGDVLVNPFPVMSRRTKGVGTALYAAPEQLNSSKYDISADIYSVGMVIYELYQIFRTNMERVMALKDLRESNQCSDSFADLWPEWTLLVEAMVHKLPVERPTAKKVLAKIRRMGEMSETGRLRKQLRSLEKRNQQLIETLRAYQQRFGSIEEVNGDNVQLIT